LGADGLVAHHVRQATGSADNQVELAPQHQNLTLLRAVLLLGGSRLAAEIPLILPTARASRSHFGRSGAGGDWRFASHLQVLLLPSEDASRAAAKGGSQGACLLVNLFTVPGRTGVSAVRASCGKPKRMQRGTCVSIWQERIWHAAGGPGTPSRCGTSGADGEERQVAHLLGELAGGCQYECQRTTRVPI
jgi:hypothetical protein